MNKVIKIGEAEVEMTANAFTPIKFKNLFNEDLIVGLSKINNSNPDIELLSKLAFCLASQADKNVVNLEEWLSQFDMMDLISSFGEILNLWVSNTKQTSKPKKPQSK